MPKVQPVTLTNWWLSCQMSKEAALLRLYTCYSALPFLGFLWGWHLQAALKSSTTTWMWLTRAEMSHGPGISVPRSTLHYRGLYIPLWVLGGLRVERMAPTMVFHRNKVRQLDKPHEWNSLQKNTLWNLNNSLIKVRDCILDLNVSSNKYLCSARVHINLALDCHRYPSAGQAAIKSLRLILLSPLDVV